jgi:hypothetical protein
MNALKSHCKSVNNKTLVGGLEHFLFSHISGIVTPTDEYFSEGLKPPTSIDGKRFGNMKGYTRQGLTHLTISSCNLTPEKNMLLDEPW